MIYLRCQTGEYHGTAENRRPEQGGSRTDFFRQKSQFCALAAGPRVTISIAFHVTGGCPLQFEDKFEVSP